MLSEVGNIPTSIFEKSFFPILDKNKYLTLHLSPKKPCHGEINNPFLNNDTKDVLNSAVRCRILSEITSAIISKNHNREPQCHYENWLYSTSLDEHQRQCRLNTLAELLIRQFSQHKQARLASSSLLDGPD